MKLASTCASCAAVLPGRGAVAALMGCGDGHAGSMFSCLTGHHHDRAWRQAHDALRNAADEHMAQAGATMGSHDDEIGLLVACGLGVLCEGAPRPMSESAVTPASSTRFRHAAICSADSDSIFSRAHSILMA